MTYEEICKKHPRLRERAIHYAFSKVAKHLGLERKDWLPWSAMPLESLVENAWLEGHGIHVDNTPTAGGRPQQYVNIDKACEWWKSRAEDLGISLYQIELFRKAMEDSQ